MKAIFARSKGQTLPCSCCLERPGWPTKQRGWEPQGHRSDGSRCPCPLIGSGVNVTSALIVQIHDFSSGAWEPLEGKTRLLVFCPSSRPRADTQCLPKLTGDPVCRRHAPLQRFSTFSCHGTLTTEVVLYTKKIHFLPIGQKIGVILIDLQKIIMVIVITYSFCCSKVT